MKINKQWLKVILYIKYNEQITMYKYMYIIVYTSQLSTCKTTKGLKKKPKRLSKQETKSNATAQGQGSQISGTE